MSAEKRRQYGSGAVYQRSSDGRWVGSIDAGWTPRGTRRRITVTDRTEAGAKAKLDQKRRALAREETAAPGASARATVKTWADQWLPIHAQRVRASTFTTDAGAVRKWIIPTLGRRRLDALTPADVRALTTEITGAGLTTTTARHAQSVLTKMLKAAILEGHHVPQRVLLVEAPPLAVHDRDAMPLDAALAVLDAAAARPDSARWVAALLQGMRQGECLGLTWDAVDLDAGTLDVSWQLQPLPYLDRGARTFRVKPGQRVRHLEGAWHLTETKTAKGRRVIPLVPWMAAALTTWRAVAPVSPHGLVWPRPDGRPQDEKADRTAWAALQETAGVRHPAGRHYTLHEARHTAATLLLEAGVDPEVIKAILGHSSIVTSRGYQHVSQELARKALADVATRLALTGPSAPAPGPGPA